MRDEGRGRRGTREDEGRGRRRTRDEGQGILYRGLDREAVRFAGKRVSLDQDAFRAVLGRFASGVTIITVRSVGGRDYGMTVSAFSSVSLEPPLVMVCIGDDASLRPMIAEAEHFGVSILAAGQEALSRRFAAHGERFEGIGFTRGENGVALIEGSLAYMECRIVARHPAGDHSIVVGEVEAASVGDDRPLLYYRGGYAQLER